MKKISYEYIEEIRTLFKENAVFYGDASSPNTAGLLELAKKGKSYWNAWADEFKDATADFSYCILSDIEDINFEDFVFPGIADFSGAQLSNKNSFRNAIFHGEANFENATFHGGAIFTDATFHDTVSFSNIECKKIIRFGIENSIFMKGDMDFSGCHFYKSLSLSPLAIDGKTIFSRSKNSKKFPFFDDIVFISEKFKGGINFEDARFTTWVNFLNFSGDIKLIRAKFEGDVDFSNANFTALEFIDTVFHQACSFRGTKYNGDAIFKRIVFLIRQIFQKMT